MPAKVIDLYAGFMDEEVNARLKEILDRELGKPENERRPVILVERNIVDDTDPILQWPRYRYPCQVLRTMHVSPPLPPDAWPEGEAPDQILARALLVFMEQGNEPAQPTKVPVIRYFELQTLLNHSISERRKTGFDSGGPWLSVIRFAVGQETNPPVIVIRSPEMGLQPGLIADWLEFLLQMLSPLSSQLAHAAKETAEWPICLSCFGAGGATQGTKPPGSTTDICASLFVGVEYQGKTPASVIKLQTLQRTYTFFLQPGTGKPDAAQEKFATGTALTTIREAEESQVHWGEPEPDGIKAQGTPIAEVIQQVKQHYGKEVSMTASFFIEQAEKETAQALSLDSCNMEDAHVITTLRLCAARSHQKEGFCPLLDLDHAFITRVNCDPHVIDESVADVFQQVIQTPWLTVEDYADLMLWGLDGVLKTAIPACAAWRIADPVYKLSPTLLQQQFYTFATDTANVIADPFCVEIATDLLADLADGSRQPFGAIPVPPHVVKLARELLEAREQLHQSREELRERAIDLMNAVVKECDFGAGGSGTTGIPALVKTWLRPGKWPGIAKSYALEDLAQNSEQFEGAAIDRAFYKSSNIMALQTEASKALL